MAFSFSGGCDWESLEAKRVPAMEILLELQPHMYDTEADWGCVRHNVG